ncbi:hypothetical protein JTE90_009550 [Oedothorax gibbosus]|uniref:Peroxisomal membrane protein 11B n=1 Tax=Oedothorax gibbosus TaxID=931172 RepID=A0AAV6UTF1_9ARAC|nr:hypothetical protein JTE90_009550 [Oedothorax gibbosus]
MDKLVKLNNQSSGRDKLFRLVQYSSKFLWATLETRGKDKDVIDKLKELETILSTGRKLYRFGRGFDTMYAALSSLHLADLTLRYTVTFSKINMALYLFADHIIWLGRVGLIKVDKQKWTTLSYKLWLYYLVMNLTRDVYEISRIMNKLSIGGLNHELHGRKPQPSNTIFGRLNLLRRALLLHKDVVVDTVKNGCDVCLPLSQLGYLPISPRTVGLLGAVSSIAGILPLLDSSFKLAP